MRVDPCLHDVGRRLQRARIQTFERLRHPPRRPRAPRSNRASASRSNRSMRRHCCASSAARRDRRAFSACRRQISASTLCVKRMEGQGSRSRQIDDRREEVADDRVEGPLVEHPFQLVPEGGRSVLRHRIRDTVDHVPRGVEIESRGAFGRVGAGNRPQVGADGAHPLALVGGLRGVGERQVGDLVARGEVPHHVPRAKLAALVERQQQPGVQPENIHPSTRLGGRLQRGLRHRGRGRHVRQRLDAAPIDERAIPQLEVDQAPDARRRRPPGPRCAAISRSTRGRVDDAALAAARIEQHVTRDIVPRAAHPHAERHGKAHLRPRRGSPGSMPFIASRSIHLVVPPRSFMSRGSAAANSTSL